MPALGDVYIDVLRPADVAEFVNAQAKVYSGWTVINQLRILRTISKDAVADGYVERDFCARVKRPPVEGYSEENPNCLTADQLARLRREIPEQWYALFMVLAFTGMRWGEASRLPRLPVCFGLIKIKSASTTCSSHAQA